MAHSGLIRRLADQRGQSSVELAVGIWVLILAALIAWQIGLIVWTANAEANAARTVARAYSRTSDQGTAIKDGVNGLGHDGFDTKAIHVTVADGKAQVSMKMPLVLPWIHIPVTLPAETAVMPSTD